MTTVGQRERATQDRVVNLFRTALGYEYLGNWIDREGNANIEPALLRAWLQKRGVDDALITRAIRKLTQAAGNTGHSLYDRNREVYDLLRYGVEFKEAGEQTQRVWLVDWKHPENNHFAIAEEVTIAAPNPKAHEKRPDIVLYVNGIALGVLELKRSTVSIGEGIRQNLDNQKREFIEPFFATMQWVMAGNDTQGLRYGTIETKEKYYLEWKEPESPDDLAFPFAYTPSFAYDNPLDRALVQVCNKARFIELIHDFIVFDAGTKKLPRHNQYFGVRCAQERVRRREGGILWHTQGSGKSLTMVWLARWIQENIDSSRVLIVTDRTELDDQIEKVFHGVNEKGIHRTRSGADLLSALDAAKPRLICSLIHKFGTQGDKGEKAGVSFAEQIKRALLPDFKPKGDIYVFVDECHRTQNGDEGGFHSTMKKLLPGAMFIGFTGTPLLKTDKKKSVETFGPYIHTYKFNEAVRDGVVLDLRYEARDIDQRITSQARIDQWFEAKTRGLTDLAKAQLKQRWGKMQKVLSSRSRLEVLVDDILLDMETRDRLQSGRGNAMLVTESIYQACKLFELFDQTDLHGKCAIVTSYRPSPSDIKGEASGEGMTEKLRQYEIYRKMLADWFNEPPEVAVNKAEAFEKAVKDKFVKEPGQMKLLIVVDKLLTGFDAPPATYLYLDARMRDHGLFQAICRVNRLDGEDKEYGYVIDYKHLFKNLESAVEDYTSGALDGYDKEDVAGLLSDRLARARQDLEDRWEAVKALCEPVEPPKDHAAYMRYFVGTDSADPVALKATEPRRLALYKLIASFLRGFAAIANELPEAGFTEAQIAALRADAAHYEKLRGEVKLKSADYIDLKAYEPAMRHLIDTYIVAEGSKQLSAFDDMSLVRLIVERGAEAVKALPKSLRETEDGAAETIENNVRRLIVDETPINPKYYEKMSQLLDALIQERKKGALAYEKYLEKIVELTRQAADPAGAGGYPTSLRTRALRALYDNLGRDEALALKVDKAIQDSSQDDWRNNPQKIKRVKVAIKNALGGDEARAEQVLELAKRQNDY
jgi:type I restriction enzyme R subunit